MDFDLKELGVTLVVGAYFLYGIEVLCFLILGSNTFLRVEQSTRFTPRALLALSLGLCFAFGMLMEDVSDKFVDRDTLTQIVLMGIIPSGKTDDQIKVSTLYGDDNKKVGPLAREMAQRHLFCRFGGEHGREVEHAIINGGFELVEAEKLESAAKRLYYHAKNVVYKESTYYDELKKIQLRIDFSRSYLMISALFIPFTIILVGVRSLKLRRQWKVHPSHKLEASQQRNRLRNFIERVAMILFFLVASFILGAFSYKAEERQFDSRAYGYFSSLNASDQAPIAD